MGRVLLIADTHFGHNGISEKFRTEFSSDLDHDETIYHNIMEGASKRDELWLLGDVCFKEREFWRLREMSLYYQSVHIIMGNHEHKGLPWYCTTHSVKIHGALKKWGYWLTHIPVHPQELYRGKNIHGHVHKNSVKDPNYFNVSCENVGYKPISLQEIKQRLGE